VSTGAALGDLQCSVLATMQKSDDAVLNLSTSAQLAFIMPPQFEPIKHPGMTVHLILLSLWISC
jgi:sedoheptulokinase